MTHFCSQRHVQLLMPRTRALLAAFAVLPLFVLAVGCGSPAAPTEEDRVVSFQATGPASMQLNTTAQFTAIITYADGRRIDVTRTALWESEPAVLTFIPNTGTATAVALAPFGAQVRASVPSRVSQDGFARSSLVDVQIVDAATGGHRQ